jgi:hypothetical protein
VDFYYPIDITKGRKVYCKELTNHSLINIQKYIETSDNELLCQYLDDLVIDLLKEPADLNFLDKFLILINIRKNCLGGTLDLVSKDKTKNAVSLSYIEKLIIDNYQEKKFVEEYKGIKITCSFPIKISFFNSFYDFINKIQIENEEIKLGMLSNNEIEEYLENIPYTLLKKIKNKLYKLNQSTINLFEIRSQKDSTSFSFNYKQEELFSLIKFGFTDSLKNLLYYQYICSSKLHIPPSDYLKMTPGETKIIIKHLTDEIKKQNEKQTQSSSTPPPGLGQQPQ